MRLEVLDWGGTGPSLILLAGLNNTAHVFDAFAPQLVSRFHVREITRRGFGASSRPPDGYDTHTLALDVVNVMNALSIQSTVLLGHSIGGDELTRISRSGELSARVDTMDDFIRRGLMFILGVTVIDQTGLQGNFDIDLKWTPEPPSAPFDGRAGDADNDGASIFTAIREQLGLKLEARKGAVEVLVIDSVEHPPSRLAPGRQRVSLERLCSWRKQESQRQQP